MLQGSLSFQEVAHLASSHWRDLVFAVSIVVGTKKHRYTPLAQAFLGSIDARVYCCLQDMVPSFGPLSGPKAISDISGLTQRLNPNCFLTCPGSAGHTSTEQVVPKPCQGSAR